MGLILPSDPALRFKRIVNGPGEHTWFVATPMNTLGQGPHRWTWGVIHEAAGRGVINELVLTWLNKRCANL